MPNTKFDAKSFNAEAFRYMVNRIPNLKTNELRKSKALAGNPDIREVFSSQNGTGYARIAMRGLLDGAVVNYDGVTDIEATSTKTFEQGVVVIGRAKAWLERDFSYDITGGVDFMANIAQQVRDYWDGVDQDTLLAILSGIFGMTGDKNAEFVARHTYDITGDTQYTMGPGTLNSAINRACGANKKKFSLVICHSDVATNLENLRLIEYLKYTDKDGVQRDLGLATWNGRLVIVDDSMPLVKVVTTPETKGVYTLTISTKGIAGDKLAIGNTEYTFHATETSYANRHIAIKSSAATQAAELKKVLETQFAGIFTVANTAGQATVTLTQVVGGTGASPTVSATQTTDGTIAASIATTTSGVAEVDDMTYITYALGEGSIFYEDIGAKVPYEMSRDPKTNGGQDTLYSRQRKCFAPFGISYEKAHQATNSPEAEELADGANWTLVHSGEADASERSYIDHKATRCSCSNCSAAKLHLLLRRGHLPAADQFLLLALADGYHPGAKRKLMIKRAASYMARWTCAGAAPSEESQPAAPAGPEPGCTGITTGTLSHLRTLILIQCQRLSFCQKTPGKEMQSPVVFLRKKGNAQAKSALAARKHYRTGKQEDQKPQTKVEKDAKRQREFRGRTSNHTLRSEACNSTL